jgi:hypothetical protein
MADVVNLLGDSASGATNTTAISGCIPKDVWDAAGDFTVFVDDAQGAPLFTGTGLGWVDNLNGTITLTDTGNLGVNIDIYVRIFNITGTGVENWYLVTASDVNSITFSDTSLIGTGTWGLSGTADYSIGGIGDIRANTGGSEDLQEQLDDIGNFAADGSNNVDILINRAVNGAITTDYTVLINNIKGSINTRARFAGVNGSFIADGTQVEITTSSLLSLGLFEYFPASSNCSWENIDFNGSDDDTAGEAAYCINGLTVINSNNHTFYNCKFRNADSHGVFLRNEGWNFVGCEFSNNGLGGTGDGLNARVLETHIKDCVFKNNANGDGCYLNRAVGCSIVNSIFDTNGGNGLVIGIAGVSNSVDHCLLTGNTEDGICVIEASIFNNSITNCTSNGNVYGYNLGTTPGRTAHFSNNHAYNNSTAALNANGDVSDADFINYWAGQNLTGNPNLTGYIPDADSILIGKGILGETDTVGALPAEAGGGAGGGVMPFTGLLG